MAKCLGIRHFNHRVSSTQLHLDNLSLRLNVLDDVQLSLAAAGTNFAGLLPVFRGLEIRVPKRPSSTLSRPSVIDLALACRAVEKHAIAVGMLLETLASSDHPDVFSFEFCEIGLTDRSGNCRDFLLADPDETRSARATVSALGAVKTQAVGIPRSGHGRFLG